MTSTACEKQRWQEGMQQEPSLLNNLLESGLHSAKIPAILYTPNDELAYVSEAAREILDIPYDAKSFKDLARHWHKVGIGPRMSMPLEEWLEMATSRRRKVPYRVFEADLIDGRWFLINETTIDGGWMWIFMIEITDMKTTEQELASSRDQAKMAAETDALTGAFNRRYAEENLAQQISNAAESRQDLAIAMIDLDHFKHINDTHGHTAGDKVLCHFTQMVRIALREDDIFARYGGEEFLLILPNTDGAEAENIIERIRAQLDATALHDPAIAYTFSCGIASYNDDELQSFVSRADKALYAAKASGRNCTKHASQKP